MNPSDANSHLATLRQLKEMLDAGTLTPQEFEALKQKLVFGNGPTEAAPTPIMPIAPPAESVPTQPQPLTPFMADEVPVSVVPSQPVDWQAEAAPLPAEAAYYAPPDIAAEQRNPLTLVFAIGGALLLLALVLYLTLGNHSADEHLTSTSQTAADSTTVAPEVGPQAQQLTLPPAAAPETVRVAPATPPPAAARLRRDSVVAPVPAATAPAPAPAAPAPVKTTPKATPTTPAPAATPADTTTTKPGQR